MAHDVFVSYANEDKATADALVATLEQHQIRCWIAPRDVLPGQDYAEVLIEAIGDAQVMVLVFSSNANNAPHVMTEVERAASKGIAILPLRIEDVAPSSSMEYFISRTHWLDALTPPLKQHLERLARSVATLLDAAEGVAESEGERGAHEQGVGEQRAEAAAGRSGPSPVLADERSKAGAFPVVDRTIVDRFSALRIGEKIIIIAGVILFIDGFLPWYRASFEFLGTVSVNGWEEPGAIWSILAILVGLAMAVAVALRKLTDLDIPDSIGGLSWPKIFLGGGVAALAFVLIKLLAESRFPGLGFYLGIIAAGALAVAGFLMYREERAALMDAAARVLQADNGTKAGAFAVDWLLVTAAWIVGLIIIPDGGESAAPPSWIVALFLGWPLIWFLYSWAGNSLGQTVGKQIFRLMTIRHQGEEPLPQTLDQARELRLGWSPGFLRAVISLVSLYALGIGYWTALTQSEGRTWHDLAAGARVVKVV